MRDRDTFGPYRGNYDPRENATEMEQTMTIESVKRFFFFCEEVQLPVFEKLEMAWSQGEDVDRPHWETVLSVEYGVRQSGKTLRYTDIRREDT